MKGRKYLTLIITILALVAITALATFAYFSTTRNLEANTPVNVGTASTTYSFTATSEDSIEFSLSALDMSEENISINVLKSDSAVLNVTLTSPSETMVTTCTYDIVWVWDSDDKYTTPDVELPYTFVPNEEILIKYYGITKEQYDQTKNAYEQENGAGTFEQYLAEELGVEFNYELSTKVDNNTEVELSSLPLEANNKTVKIQRGLKITSYGLTPTTKTNKVTVNVYNLPVVQNNLFAKKFKAHISVDNIRCNMQDISAALTNAPTIESYITDTVYNSELNQENIAINEAGLYFHNENLNIGANDGIYRYTGARGYPRASEGFRTYSDIINGTTLIYNNQSFATEEEAVNQAIADGFIVNDAINNYICFIGDDCEDENSLYRIISVNPATGNLKVIKATGIGIMAWNDAENIYTYPLAESETTAKTTANMWAIKKDDGTYYTSTLNEYLNTTYLSSLGFKKELILPTSWPILKISTSGGTYLNTYSISAPSSILNSENSSEKYEAKIGLMTLSEYGYASIPVTWNAGLSERNASWYGNNWLLNLNDPWILESAIDVSSFLVSNKRINHAIVPVLNEGVKSDIASNGHSVYPAFNIASNIKILNIDGENIGSKNNPMLIGR